LSNVFLRQTATTRTARIFCSVVFAMAVACAPSDDQTGPQVLPRIAPAGFSNVLRIDPHGGLPKLTKRAEPRIPNELFGVNTAVKVDVYVGEDGKVAGVVYTEGDPRFFLSVSKAASQWRFEPLVAESSPRRFVFLLTTTLTWRTNPVAARVVLDYHESGRTTVPPK
jgi:hypothetical protein